MNRRPLNPKWPNPRFLLLLLFPVMAGTGVVGEKPLVVVEGETQGTTYHIKYRDERQRNLKPAIDSVLTDIDKCLSLYRPDSEISQFNRTQTHQIRSPYFYPVLQKAAEVFRVTNGAMDPTVMPLVEAYGFGAKKVTQTGYINLDSLLQLVGFHYILFDSTSVKARKPNVRLDLNSIAQGYTVDVMATFLETEGIDQYMVEIGGEVRTRGRKSDTQAWTIGIENPLHPSQLHTTMKLTNRAMTTAGNYRNRYEQNGQVFSHIINPKTGLMEQRELLSVTVFAPDAITADAFDTAFMVMGLEKTKQLLATRPDLDAYILYTGTDGQLRTFMTDGLKSL